MSALASAGAPGGRRLLERLAEFNAWPTSRKTAVLATIALAGDIFASIVARFAFASSGVVHVDSMDRLLVGGSCAIALAAAISWLVHRAGREGRWTAYLFIFLYGGFILVLLQACGIWSTPFMTMYPLAVLVMALWYDGRIGWFCFFFGLVLGSGAGLLQFKGLLPYAPLLAVRSIDAQNSVGWFLGAMAVVMVFFLFCFVLCLTVVGVRQLQTQRLEELGAALERSHAMIRRYVPAQVADAISRADGEVATGHQRRKLTLFFSDLVGFTEIAEELEPEDLSRVLNDYFTEMNRIANHHGGTVDELMGDAILIFFGAPAATDDKDHALRAARMALDMQAAMAGLNAAWREAGIPESLRVRMGINTGVVTVGNFGSAERMKYAALGKHVNLAARLQAQCEPGRVLLSYATWLLVNDHMVCIPKSELSLKGIQKPVMTYELVPPA